jgi:hypothetical protein
VLFTLLQAAPPTPDLTAPAGVAAIMAAAMVGGLKVLGRFTGNGKRNDKARVCAQHADVRERLVAAETIAGRAEKEMDRRFDEIHKRFDRVEEAIEKLAK